MKRWAQPAFTIVEILVIVFVLLVLVGISITGYSSIRKSAAIAAVQSDLSALSNDMQRAYQKTGGYPQTLPSEFEASKNSTVTVVSSGESPYYTNLSAIQNGVLLSQICQDLIDDGVGKGVDQGGTTRDYVIGCGNWNDDSMQITAWDTKKWDTPVTKEQLQAYAAGYTVSNSFHKQAQEATVKNFYQQLITLHEKQGGSFPISSFWDFWATPSNGGVQLQPLATNPQVTSYFCAEAQSTKDSTVLWHITEDQKMKPGGCS